MKIAAIMAWVGVAHCAAAGSAHISPQPSLDKMPRNTVNLSQPIDVSKNTGVDPIISENWAGAAISGGPNTYSTVVGLMRVPLPYNGGTPTSARVWVGLDGLTCKSTMLQTGFYTNINATGWITYSAWYRWYPEPEGSWDGFGLGAGDEILMSVFADTPKSGFALIENLTMNTTAITRFENKTSPICGQDAA
ncbi:peptidase A4 family-domain-containing protein [Xylariaceae sp. FL1272]|nr:peptidase A4 family-domain-containing protein [Xylariaceae sp. FL1272]